MRNPPIPEWKTFIFSADIFLTRICAFHSSAVRCIAVLFVSLLLLLFYNSSSVIKYYL
jgi:hypothetical protein